MGKIWSGSTSAFCQSWVLSRPQVRQWSYSKSRSHPLLRRCEAAKVTNLNFVILLVEFPAGGSQPAQGVWWENGKRFTPSSSVPSGTSLHFLLVPSSYQRCQKLEISCKYWYIRKSNPRKENEKKIQFLRTFWTTPSYFPGGHSKDLRWPHSRWTEYLIRN